MTKPVDPGREPAETVGFIRSTIVLPQRGTVCYRAGVRTITEAQLRNESTAILRDVQSGHSMIVTRDGMPVAESGCRRAGSCPETKSHAPRPPRHASMPLASA